MTVLESIKERIEISKMEPNADTRYDLERDREYLVTLAEEVLAENEVLRTLISSQAGFEVS